MWWERRGVYWFAPGDPHKELADVAEVMGVLEESSVCRAGVRSADWSPALEFVHHGSERMYEIVHNVAELYASRPGRVLVAGEEKNMRREGESVYDSL